MEEETRPEENQQESPMPEAKKVKKGLSFSQTTVHLLEAKAKESSRNQSDVADAILAFGLPAFDPETGISKLTIIYSEDYNYLTSHQERTTAAAPETVLDQVPAPEPAPMRRGHREKLQIPVPAQPGGTLAPPQQPIVDQPEDNLYRPPMGQGTDPIPAQAVEQPVNQRLSRQELDYIVASIVSVQAMSMPMPQPYPQMQPVIPGDPSGLQQPVDVNPYNQQMPNVPTPIGYELPQQPPPPPPQPVQVEQFGYMRPGHTGAPPRAQSGVPVPQQPEGIYPYPGNEGQLRDQQQQAQPGYMSDPYAMNIGNQVANQQQPLTAQGLLSGAQQIAPNMAQRNVNIEVAKAGLGANWRQNLHSMTAANRRG